MDERRNARMEKLKEGETEWKKSKKR